MTTQKIAFIGGGNMTRAIAGGMIASGFDGALLLISEPNADARQTLRSSLPATTITANNKDAASVAGCVVLSVKPQILADVCRKLSGTIQSTKPLVVSIAAGVRSEDIDDWLGGGLSVVRIMPNQPALLRLGVSGLYANERTTSAEKKRATDIMSSVGAVIHVDNEAEIDAVTAVSGSGPAYFFLLIDVLATTAVALGIDAAAARTLAIETARGAAELAAHHDADMDELIARVRSPGGTTAAALDSLDAANVRAIFADAISAARDRAVTLADATHKNQT